MGEMKIARIICKLFNKNELLHLSMQKALMRASPRLHWAYSHVERGLGLTLSQMCCLHITTCQLITILKKKKSSMRQQQGPRTGPILNRHVEEGTVLVLGK